jgi:hypothetical protein
MLLTSDRRATIGPWALVGWTSADLVVFWLFTIAAGSHVGGFGALPFVVLGPLYLAACIGVISGVATLQVRRGRTQLHTNRWLIAAVLLVQALFVADIWNGFALPVSIGNLAMWAALLSAPSVALLHLAFTHVGDR